MISHLQNLKAHDAYSKYVSPFQKKIKTAENSYLENMILQKIVEALLYKSEISDLRKRVEMQNTIISELQKRVKIMHETLTHQEDTERNLTNRFNQFPTKLRRVTAVRDVAVQVVDDIDGSECIPSEPLIDLTDEVMECQEQPQEAENENTSVEGKLSLCFQF